MYAWQLAPPSSREPPRPCPGAWQRRQAARYDEQDAQQYAQQQAAAPPPAPAEDDQTAKLQNLANLHAQGVLTDEEFAAAKAKALGI